MTMSAHVLSHLPHQRGSNQDEKESCASKASSSVCTTQTEIKLMEMV